MKKSDPWVVLVIYAIVAFFTFMTLNLPEAAQTYPLCLLTAIGCLNTLYFAIALKKRATSAALIDDVKESFADFVPAQFFTTLVLCAGYLVLIWTLGYYLSSVMYVALAMYLLKVPKTHILISVVVLMAVIYVVFSTFLRVPLPAGLIFG